MNPTQYTSSKLLGAPSLQRVRILGWANGECLNKPFFYDELEKTRRNEYGVAWKYLQRTAANMPDGFLKAGNLLKALLCKFSRQHIPR